MSDDKTPEFEQFASIRLDDYIDGLKAELAREGSDKAAVKAELTRITKGAKENADAPKAGRETA